MTIKIEINNVTDKIYPDIWCLIEKIKQIEGVVEIGGGIIGDEKNIAFSVDK